MIKLPENLNNFNMTNKKYMTLSVDERFLLAEKLPTNSWEFLSESEPNMKKPDLPCVIDGVIIGE